MVSGTNIKTINNESILGSGNITIQSGATYTAGTGITISNNVISTTVAPSTITYRSASSSSDTPAYTIQRVCIEGVGPTSFTNTSNAGTLSTTEYAYAGTPSSTMTATGTIQYNQSYQVSSNYSASSYTVTKYTCDPYDVEFTLPSSYFNNSTSRNVRAQILFKLATSKSGNGLALTTNVTGTLVNNVLTLPMTFTYRGYSGFSTAYYLYSMVVR